MSKYYILLSQNDNDLSRINKLVVDKALQTSLFYEKLLDDEIIKKIIGE
mgnify:CR=1 FL=1